MLLMDWVGLAVTIYYSISSDTSFGLNYYNIAATILVCAHTLGMIHCLMQLKDLSLSKKDVQHSAPSVPIKRLIDLEQCSARAVKSAQNLKTDLIKHE
ncbi:hypothetical protein HDV06_006664 [Boothiomyces sp. JEL0866]|nr:hypothetical protein HDV06_006664 [Boothiomyces sp. JEL0866]